jgi:uncharacterized membrane protein YhaH (DUF805 family)
MEENFAMEPMQYGHQAPVAGLIIVVIWLLFVLLVTAITALIYCRIFHKAGYSWALGLLMLVPIANIIMPFILAFGRWPIETKLRQLERQRTNPAG